MIDEVLSNWTTMFDFVDVKINASDSSTGMSYLQNLIQHKKLVYGSENHYSMQGLNSPQFVWKLQKVAKGTWRITRASAHL